MPEQGEAPKAGESRLGEVTKARQSGTEKPVPPQRWSKPLEYWFARQLVRSLALTGRVTTSGGIRRIGRALGNACWNGMPRYQKVAMANLRRAYGDQWSEAQIEACARESFRHTGMTIAEFFLRMPRIAGEEIDREVRFEGQEHYEAAFARGKGVILITAHYGNWEMMGPRLARAGYQVNAISRTVDDPGLERMIETNRTRSGLKQIPRKLAAREGLGALRRNEILAILLDQNTLEGGVFVPFYGHPASTATGPAVFALKTGAAILPTFCLREADGTHTMRAWPAILPQPTGNRSLDVYHLTAAITHVIEQQIRERPELWLWLHNRWKLQPAPTEMAHWSPRHGFSQSLHA